MTGTGGLVEVERAERIAWIRLNRPPRNLLDAELTAELHRTLCDLDADGAVGALVLTGAGELFCGGADGARLRETGTARAFADAAVALFGHFPVARKPILAAVNGDALAGGFGLVCSADIVVAAEGSRLGTIEATLGSWPMIAQAPVVRRVPVKAALTNALTGQPFDARRALELGIVDDVVPAARLADRTRHYARLAMAGGPAALDGRALFLAGRDLPYDQALRRGADAFVRIFGG